MTPSDPVQQSLAAALRPQPAGARPVQGRARLLVAGAGGALGAEVLHRLAASGVFAHTEVLVTAPMVMMLPRVVAAPVGLNDLNAWPVMRSGPTPPWSCSSRPDWPTTASGSFSPPCLRSCQCWPAGCSAAGCKRWWW